jgi:hypothetical protein
MFLLFYTNGKKSPKGMLRGGVIGLALVALLCCSWVFVATAMDDEDLAARIFVYKVWGLVDSVFISLG